MNFLNFPGTEVAYADLNSFLINVSREIINPLITLIFALAIVYFLYGVVEFLMNQDNDEKKTTGKSHMLWGVIGLTIMIGVITIMNMILDTLEIKGIDVQNGTVDLE